MAEAVLCAVCRVGAGLRPRPVFRGRGIRRGRPMCRPGHGSVAGPIHGRTHRSAPTRGGERSGTNGNRCRNGPRQRGGTEPAPYRRRSRPARPGRRGKGYGSNAGSAQQRADVPKAWLPPTKFRAEIWGVSHGHRPLRGDGESPINHPGQRRTAERLRRGRKGWVEIGVEIILKGAISLGQSLSHGLWP